MPTVDPFDADVLEQISAYLLGLDPPNTRFDGYQVVRPTLHVVHHGRTDGFNFQSSILRLEDDVAGSAAKALVIQVNESIGDLITVKNTNPSDPNRIFLLLTEDGKLSVFGGSVSPNARFSVSQGTSGVTAASILAAGTSGNDLLQLLDSSAVKQFYVDIIGQVFHKKNTFFTGAVLQVGSLTPQIPTFSGSAIGISDLTTPVFTGVSTNGIAIVSTDSRLRYVDDAGNVWRMPDGNSLPELHDLKSWNFDPVNATGGAQMDEGRLYFFKTLFHRSTQPTSIRFHVLGVANSPDPSYFGIYDLAGNRLCQTGDISSLTTTTGTKTAALVSPPTMLPNYYYIAALFGAGPGSGPTLATAGVPAGIANANLSGATLRFGQGSSTANTTLPSTFTLSGLAETTATLWVGTA